MNKFVKSLGLMSLMLGFGVCAQAQEPAQPEEIKKENFMKRAFRDMKESAKLQHQIDKANFKAQRLETKAFYEEQKRLSKPAARTAAEKERMQQELEAANQRVAAAQAKVNTAKQ